MSEQLAPTKGTCMVMGTASTMGCIVETLGMGLPGSGSIPATHSDRLRVAEATGKLAAEMAVKQGPKPSEIMTRAAIRNALTVLQAIGGSTNALVHLTAIARRLGIEIELEEFDAIGRKVPVLVDLKPSGDHYMEHFHWAGGNSRLMREISAHLDVKCRTVAGKTIKQVIDAAEIVPNQTVIRTTEESRSRRPAAVLRGNPRRAAPSSSTRRRPPCHSTPAAPSSSICWRISPLEATILHSTSRPTTSWCCATPDRRAHPACRRPARSRSR